MNDQVTQSLRAIRLPGFAVLRVSGPDSVPFLQGQFTSDLRALADGRTQLSACCTNQGRVIALVRFRQTSDACYALLPADLLDKVSTHLRKFVLRAKVELTQPTELVVGTVPGRFADLGQAALTKSPRPSPVLDGAVSFQYAVDREVIAAPAAAWRSIGGEDRSGVSAQADWRALDVAQGLPQVDAATSEHFIPQMLNLDLLDAISFTKGCYTGQEIVARTQHLGRVKRRTLRFHIAGAGSAPAPMSNLLLDGAKAADVLMTAQVADGIELLAVTNLDSQGKTLVTEDGRAAEPRPLPYGIGSG